MLRSSSTRAMVCGMCYPPLPMGWAGQGVEAIWLELAALSRQNRNRRGGCRRWARKAGRSGGCCEGPTGRRWRPAGGGRPYASLVLIALEPDAAPLLLLSDLAEHSRNIAREPRVSPAFRRHGGACRSPDRGPAEPGRPSCRSRDTGPAGPLSRPPPLGRALCRLRRFQALPGRRSSRAHLVAGFGKHPLGGEERRPTRCVSWRPWPRPSPPSSPI